MMHRLLYVRESKDTLRIPIIAVAPACDRFADPMEVLFHIIDNAERCKAAVTVFDDRNDYAYSLPMTDNHSTDIR